jgi:hypothetical protein
MQRQIQRKNLASDILRNEKGIDPKTGADVTVFESTYEPDTYENVIESLIQKSKKTTWGYDIIENTVHVGVYRDFMRLGEGKLLEMLVNQQSGKNYPAYSYIHYLLGSICEPIFLKNLSDESKFELLTGEVAVYICIDYDKILEIITQQGFSARWASTKETHSLKEKHKIDSWICIENRALIIDLGEEKSIVGDGLIARIVADNLLPTVATLSLLELIDSELLKTK